MNSTLNWRLRMAAGHSHHVFHQGRNRNQVFQSPIEKSYFLELVQICAGKRKCTVHSYCLMSNHFHLLVTSAEEGGLSAMMRDVLGQYAIWFNRLNMRSGAVWNGPYKSLAIDSDSYILACMKYIELNPCKARIVSKPEDFKWSSYRINAMGNSSNIITMHQSYADLSSDPVERLLAYREFCVNQLD
jgi:putative transposase